MKKFLPAAMSGLALTAIAVSCVHSEMKSDRNPSADYRAVDLREPKTGLTFTQEFAKAQAGMDAENPYNDKYQWGVFLRWMHANPIAAFQDLRAQSSLFKLGTVTRRGNRPQDVYVVSRGEDVLAVLQNSNDFSVEPYFRKGRAFVVSAETNPPSPAGSYIYKAVYGADRAQFRAYAAKLAAAAVDKGSWVGTDYQGKYFGRLDVINGLARRVPRDVNTQLIGIRAMTDRESYALSRSLQDDVLFNLEDNAQIYNEGQAALKVVETYFQNLMNGKIEPEQGTWMEAIVRDFKQRNIRLESLGTKERMELISMGGSILSGVVNTQTAVARAVDQLLAHGQVENARSAAIRNDDAALDKYIREALRFAPVQPYVYRLTRNAVDLPSGLRVPAGSLVVVGTQSAMFDERLVRDPLRFDVNRPDSNYLLFSRSGAGQLRDTLSEIEVSEMVKAIVRKPGLRRVEAHYGQVDDRWIYTFSKTTETFRYSFPEAFAVEFDAEGPRNRVEISHPLFAYEDYLKDYDRASYRACLSNLPIVKEGQISGMAKLPFGKMFDQKLSANIRINAQNRLRESKHIFYCRLPSAYRACVQNKITDLLDPALREKHKTAFLNCNASLNNTEREFYRDVFFDQGVDESQLSTEKAVSKAGPEFAFEEELRFYDRYRGRESMMNPLSVPYSARDILFYVRLNIDFRMCVGKKILANKYSGGLLGEDAPTMYDRCKNGVYDPNTQTYLGALTLREKWYYEQIMLNRKVSYEDVVRKESAARP